MLLSAIIPVHNGERFLAEAVESIQSQSHPNLEVLIVDDGSTDGTPGLAARLGPTVRCLRQEHQGPAAARNAGLRAARGEIIGFLDADDLWPAGRLDLMLPSLLHHPAVSIVVGRTRRVAETPGGAWVPIGEPAHFPFSIGAALYRRDVFEHVGLFDRSLRFGEDQDWFLRAREASISTLEIDQVTQVARRHGGSMTRGKTLLELNLVRVFKMSLDRRRTAATAGPAGFFAAAHESWDRARTARGAEDRDYRIGGYRVRLRFAGPALVPRMTPALGHLEVPAGEPADLTVHLWDTASTGTPMPPPPWRDEDHGVRGEIRGYCSDRFRTVFSLGDHAFRMIDRTSNQALFWIADADRVPYYESGAPLRVVLHWWMAGRGRQLAHAAAVGSGHGGVLLAGRGGSGKSTSALACLLAGMRYAGDDYVLVAPGREPFAHSLYSTAKLDREQVTRFPALGPMVDNAHRLSSEKALVFLARHRPEALSAGFPLRAILLPRITGRPDTRIRPASRAASLAALAPTTVFQLPGHGTISFDALSDIARSLPAHWLDLGTDLETIPPAIEALLASGGPDTKGVQ